ncbi:hypothetical protein COLO4_24332 [Corchorus olitorius]|uniref:Uncharacterized protein n=1 Tax=Corchorus olitorius TaxID=93759 RepID=A0A1R3IB05_9ROSI|nr:hypothetical protein COLO4_24332 [Corchorus olitorius]
MTSEDITTLPLFLVPSVLFTNALIPLQMYEFHHCITIRIHIDPDFGIIHFDSGDVTY